MNKYSDILFDPDTGNLSFKTPHSSSERMTIASNGNVGIGTTSPNKKLHVFGVWKDQIQFQQSSGTTNYAQLSSGTEWVGLFTGGINESTMMRAYHDGSKLIFENGNIGIGTTSPNYKLSVANGVFNVEKNGDYYGFWVEDKLRTDNPKINLGAWYNSRGGVSYNSSGKYLTFDTQTSTTTYSNTLVLKDGDVGIGTTDTQGFKLGVNGDVAALEVKIATYANWPDYVFNDTYNLPALEDVEQQIKNKGHLKDIPSAEKVKEEGFYLGDMDAKLLQKIEELTLYTIKQEKKIEALENQVSEIETLKKENAELKSLSKRLAAIEALLNNQKQ